MQIFIKSFKLFTLKLNCVCNIILSGCSVSSTKFWNNMTMCIKLKQAIEIQTNKVLASVSIKRIRLSTRESDGRSQRKITEINIFIKQIQQGKITDIYIATAKIQTFSPVRFWYRWIDLSVLIKKTPHIQVVLLMFSFEYPSRNLSYSFYSLHKFCRSWVHIWLPVPWYGTLLTRSHIHCTMQYTVGSHGTMYLNMMTSSNGNIFRVTGHLCKEFTGHRWIPRTNASDAELWCFLWSGAE